MRFIQYFTSWPPGLTPALFPEFRRTNCGKAFRDFVVQQLFLQGQERPIIDQQNRHGSWFVLSFSLFFIHSPPAQALGLTPHPSHDLQQPGKIPDLPK